MSSTCPFCRNDVKAGASVCASCGAFESNPIRRNGAMALFLLFLWGNYLLIGPGLIVVAFDKNDPALGVALIGLAITVVGFFLLRAISKWICRPLWYRRN